MATTNLVAFFSHRGKNYVNGKIEDLKIGNTEVVAHEIARLIKADLFHIQQEYAYPIEYEDTTEVAKAELKAQARPTLTAQVTSMDGYDTIFLGYPNWWGTIPMAVATFLESYNFSNKRIIPFCTHEGSGMGGVSFIEKLCPQASIQHPFALKGSSVQSQEANDTIVNIITKVKANT